MFCSNCGSEIKEGMTFCPGCGKAVIQASSAKASKKNPLTIGMDNSKKKRIIIIAAVILVAIVYLIANAGKAELAVVKSVAESQMDSIRQGLDDQTMNMLVESVIDNVSDSETINSILKSNISGQDVNDIYSALMKYMYYEVTNVEKVESGHYKVTIYVQNINNVMVAENALGYFASRYTGKGKIGVLIQAIIDLQTDKSEAIASLFEEIADYMYTQNNSSYFVSGSYVIDVQKQDGEWVPSCEEGLARFALKCAGF